MNEPDYTAKILTMEDMAAERDRLHEQDETLVQCHGCFDIVHPGHVRYLRYAKSLGSKLLVSVSADSVVNKGVDRPYIAEDLRLDNLAALEFVDYVCLSDDDWAGPALEKVRPDIYVKGKEYETNEDPRFAREKALVESNGGKVVFSSGDVVFSSTKLIQFHRSRMFESHRIGLYCRRHGIDQSSITELFRAFSELKVAVFGDPILDQYVHCAPAQVASEGPFLSVTPTSDDWYVGGAGLIARQMASLGAQVRFITTSGPERLEVKLRDSLDKAGIELELIPCESRPIYVKTRYIVDGQKVFKIDHHHPAPLPSDRVDTAIASLSNAFSNYDGVVVSDFGYGLFGDRLSAALAGLSQKTKTPYFADVSTNGRANLLKFRGSQVATPTERELRFALGDNESGISPLAAKFYEESDARGLVITMGARGAVFFEPPEKGQDRLKSDYLPALATTPVDAVGAGDRFLSGLTLTELAGRSRALGVYLGSALASLGVMHMGNESISLAELEQHLSVQPELHATDANGDPS